MQDGVSGIVGWMPGLGLCVRKWEVLACHTQDAFIHIHHMDPGGNKMEHLLQCRSDP